jgi:signal peptidase I
MDTPEPNPGLTPAPSPAPEAVSAPPNTSIGEPSAEMAQPAPRVAAHRQEHAQGNLLTSIQSLSITVIIAVFVITFVVQAFQIPSESMENTLLIGDYLLVDKVHFASGGVWGRILPYDPIHRGDIIVFRYPVHPQEHFVKRVIGLPGDHIRLKGKRVFVNGMLAREPYVIYRKSDRNAYRDDFPRTDLLDPNIEARWWLQMRALVHNGELVVPPGQYFALGDNRDESLDSRYWGFVPRENIIGRPLLIYWSIQHPDQIGPMATSFSDKLLYFAYTVSHLFQEARWNRAFRLIR